MNDEDSIDLEYWFNEAERMHNARFDAMIEEQANDDELVDKPEKNKIIQVGGE